MDTINTCNINPPVDTIPLDIIKPYLDKVDAMADTGANISCINAKIAQQYKHLILYDKRASNVRTANGIKQIRAYIPIELASPNNKKIKCKLYVFNDIPCDYLVGRRVLHALGYK